MSPPPASSAPASSMVPPAPAVVAPPPEQNLWFKEEVHPLDGQLKAWLHHQFPAVHDVDDVVQESYLRIWKARATHPIQSAKAFLFKVAHNVALELLRRRQKSPVSAVPDLEVLPILEEGKGVAEAACSAEETALLAEAIDSLPARCREIILLRKYHHLSQREVALRLGISEVTVSEQVYRGVRKMEKFLSDRGVIRAWHP